MKYIIICIISTILAKFSIAQTTSNYPLIFEGYPYFDEYGLPTDKNVTLMHNGSPTFPLCSPYLPYLFNFNNCMPKNKASIGSFYCNWIKREVPLRNSSDELHIAVNKFLNTIGISTNDEHVDNGKTDTVYKLGSSMSLANLTYSNKSAIPYYTNKDKRWKIDKKEIVVYLQNEQTTSTINKAIDPNTKEKLKSSNSILKKLTKYTVGFVINQNERIKRDSIIIKKYAGNSVVQEYKFGQRNKIYKLIDAYSTNDNSIIITCNVQSEELSETGNYFYCIKISADGQKLWEKSINGNGATNSSARLTCSKKLKNGDILLGGNLQGQYLLNNNTGGAMISNRQPSTYPNIFFVCRISNNGNIIWQKVFPTNGENKLYDILSNDDKRIYLVGTSTYNLYFNPHVDYPKTVSFESNIGIQCERPINMLVSVVIDENGNILEKKVINEKIQGLPIGKDLPFRYNVFTYGFVTLNKNEEFEYSYIPINTSLLYNFIGRSSPPYTGTSEITTNVNFQFYISEKTPAFTLKNVPKIIPISPVKQK